MADLATIQSEEETREHLRGFDPRSRFERNLPEPDAPLCNAEPDTEIREQGDSISRCILPPDHGGTNHYGFRVIRGSLPVYVSVSWLDPEALRTLADRVESRQCTGVSARWCPVHGNCRCSAVGYLGLNDPSCPLHAPTSAHAAS